jgi:hypothetical protein
MLLRVVPEEGQDVLPEDSTAVGERVALTDIAFEPSCYGESLRVLLNPDDVRTVSRSAGCLELALLVRRLDGAAHP